MNGRLYDPLLRRFLNADENIQDPYNTQNYNKYGYVFNNPLMYNDPNGEFVWFVPIIAAVVSEFFTMYYTQTPFNGARFVGSLAMSYASAGIAGAIGDVFKIASVAEALGKWGTIVTRAGAHALTQGIFSIVQGGNFWSGALSGAFASISGDLLGMATDNSGANNILRSDGFALFNGAVSGGIGSVLGGGNFWMGAGQGLIVTAFNHVAHKEKTIVDTELNDPPGKGTHDWLGDGGNIVYNGKGYFGSNYIGPGPDIDPNELLKGGLKPLDMVDQAAFNHDIAYYRANTGGVKGALLEKSITYADLSLAADAKKVINGYKKGAIDIVTGEKISERTYNMARLVYAAFKSIEAQKSIRVNIDTKINNFYNIIINNISRNVK